MNNVTNTFWEWSGWVAINSICQILLSLFALIAIIITLNQISIRNKPKVNIELHTGLGLMKYENNIQIVSGATISVCNLNLAPLYINCVGIQFASQMPKKNNPSSNGIIFNDGSSCINPGELKEFSQPHLDSLFKILDSDTSVNHTAYLFIKLANGNYIYKKTDYTYMSFKAEIERIRKKAENPDT